MTVSLNLKKSLALAALATPFMVAACGSDAEESEADAVASSTVTSEATPSTKSETESSESSPTESTTEDSDDPEPPTEPEDGQASAGAGAAGSSGEIVNPFENGDIEVAEVGPVEGGQPASEGDRQAISGLVGGLYEQTTMHSFLRYMPDHTCQRVLEQNGGGDFSLEGVPDMPMDQLPGWGDSHVSDIADVQVNGDQASAVVTVQTAEGPDTATQRFQREGGNWAFCN